MARELTQEECQRSREDDARTLRQLKKAIPMLPKAFRAHAYAGDLSTCSDAFIAGFEACIEEIQRIIGK